MELPEIQPTDFTSFQPGVTFPHVTIEQLLIDIGGAGVSGAEFKAEVLTAAGWKYGKLISYGAHPEVAAEAFNKLRGVLGTTQDKDSIIKQLH